MPLLFGGAQLGKLSEQPHISIVRLYNGLKHGHDITAHFLYARHKPGAQRPPMDSNVRHEAHCPCAGSIAWRLLFGLHTALEEVVDDVTDLGGANLRIEVSVIKAYCSN
jgi:hypothetical protein